MEEPEDPPVGQKEGTGRAKTDAGAPARENGPRLISHPRMRAQDMVCRPKPAECKSSASEMEAEKQNQRDVVDGVVVGILPPQYSLVIHGPPCVDGSVEQDQKQALRLM